MSEWGSLVQLAGGVFMDPEAGPIEGRVLVYKLGGKAQLSIPKRERVLRKPPPSVASAEEIALGKTRYYQQCMGCHGLSVISGGGTPDLRYSALLENDGWYKVVLDGMLEENGMISFRDRLSKAEVTAIRAFVIDKANADWDAATAAKAGVTGTD
jgi:mono/diheme cytochrome c family protein